MFPVSQDYKDKIGSDDRTFKLNIRIEHSKGTLNLTQDDIVQGSFKHRDSSQSGNDYTIGGVVASDIEFSIMAIENKYDDIVFSEAIVYPTVALKVIDGQDAHFLQPTQPSKMKGFDDKWEEVPLGKFNIDIVERTRGRILIKAIDNMIFLDSPYSRSKLSYPATLFQIYENICSVNNLLVGTLNFPNKNYVVKKRPSDDLTFREVLSMVAELSGSFATINTIGKLELKWYSPTGVDILPSMRYDSPELIFGDDIQITGIQYEVDEKIYLFGEPKYVIDISENELVSVEDLNTILPNILDRIGSVVFKPYSSSWIGNPALQVGDIVTHKLANGTEYSSIITHTEYQYFGPCSIKGSGQASITRSYSDSGAKELNRVIREVEDMLEQGKSDLEKAQDNSTELMANMLGGYFIKDEENGILYITDNPKLENSTKIWKWGTGGFGYSEDGGESWNTSITADGSIVAELVSAGIITADMVKTGLLSSQDGSTWINLDNGHFNFNNRMSFDDNGFSIDLRSEDIASIANINIILENENQSIGTDSNGATVGNRIISSKITTFKGATRVGSTIGNLKLIQGDGNTTIPTGGNTGITLGSLNPTGTVDGVVTMNINNGVVLPSNNGYILIPITIDGVIINKKLSWSKVKDGENARLVNIVASNNNFISKSTTNPIPASSYSPSQITLTPHFQNCEYNRWVYSYDGETWYIVTSGNRGLTIEGEKLIINNTSNLYSSNQNFIMFAVRTNYIDVTDIITIPRLYDSIVLQSQIIQTNTDWTASFNKLKSLNGEVIEGGNTKISIDGVKVEHSDFPGQYSELRADGFFRMFSNGEGAYLNDIYTYSRNASNRYYETRPRPVVVRLPAQFKGRRVNVSVSLRNAYIDPVTFDGRGNIKWAETSIDFIVDIYSTNMDLDRPEIEIDAYTEFVEEHYDGNYLRGYRTLGFTLIVVGEG